VENKNQKLGVKELELKANDIRNDIISMLLEAKSGHTAGPLGMADVFAALYFNILKHNPIDPTCLWAYLPSIIRDSSRIWIFSKRRTNDIA
jgi:hypothetical protein